ncbi:MAG: methyltransferase domain-containing protein [Verrucomicrobiota bacterium]
MSNNYWEELYQKGDTAWDKGEPSPGLVDFLKTSPAPPHGTVVVPGCGRGHDVRAWARAGYVATGLDIAPSAVNDSRELTRKAGLSAEFKLVNFLQETPSQPYDFLFEHTCFCAINPSERNQYRKAVKQWLKANGKFVAIFYMIPDRDGPPFGTTREEVREIFGGDFKLLEDWVPRSYPNREGLEWMTVWQRK